MPCSCRPSADDTFMLLGMAPQRPEFWLMGSRTSSIAWPVDVFAVRKWPPGLGGMLPVSLLLLRSSESSVAERTDPGDSHSVGRAPDTQGLTFTIEAMKDC